MLLMVYMTKSRKYIQNDLSLKFPPQTKLGPNESNKYTIITLADIVTTSYISSIVKTNIVIE